jgi:predicted PurR-regulated permease PerM
VSGAGAASGPARPRAARPPRRPRATPTISRRFVVLAGMVLTVACLYWAREVAIPLALALLLAFLLSPLVALARRLGLPRVPAAFTVGLFALLVAAALGWGLTAQIATLVNELPKYRATIARKISDIQKARHSGTLEKMEATAKDVMRQIEKGTPAEAPAEKPVPVVVAKPSTMWSVPNLLRSFGSAAMVIVLLFFILVQQRELRARVIRLFGHDQLAEATRLLDEASQRISRYLLMQSLINGSFGLAIGLGLYLLGVPFALALGFFAGVLRFIPFVGAWVAALVPILLSLAVFDGWTRPLLIAGLFAVTEVAVAFVLEPLLFGRSAGVSSLALLVAAAFWTWLWGPIGLMLSTPLTVLLVVFARTVDGLEFVEILLSDEAGTKPSTTFYQRLVAGDEDEAMEVMAEAVKSGSLEAAFDSVVVPALARVRLDRRARRLSRADAVRIVKTARRLVEEQPPEPTAAPAGAGGKTEAAAVVAAVPLRDAVDEAGLAMLGRLLGAAGYLQHLVPAGPPSVETVAALEATGLPLICVGAVGSGGGRRLRDLVKRLRDITPDTPILVWRSGGGEMSAALRRALHSAGADTVVSSLDEARAEALRHIAPAKETPEGNSRHRGDLVPLPSA